MSKRWLVPIGALCVALLAAMAYAASPVVNETVAIVDPSTPAQQAKVDASGNLQVNLNAQGTTADPCLNPATAKSSAVVNIGAATTTKIVDVSGTKAIYVCGFVASLAGTTPTITFVSGTHNAADCDTGATSLSGAIAPTSGSLVTGGWGGTMMTAASAKQLCGTTTGTGSSFQGVLSYVQQ